MREREGGREDGGRLGRARLPGCSHCVREKREGEGGKGRGGMINNQRRRREGEPTPARHGQRAPPAPGAAVISPSHPQHPPASPASPASPNPPCRSPGPQPTCAGLPAGDAGEKGKNRERQLGRSRFGQQIPPSSAIVQPERCSSAGAAEWGI